MLKRDFGFVALVNCEQSTEVSHDLISALAQGGAHASACVTGFKYGLRQAAALPSFQKPITKPKRTLVYVFLNT